MKTSRLGALIAIGLAAVALSGCGTSGSDADRWLERTQLEKPQKSEKPTDKEKPAEQEKSDEPMSKAELELLAKVTTNAPPKDLLWDVPGRMPDGWTTRVYEDEGTIEITVSPRCVIQFRQPAGLGTEKMPDSAQVVLDFTEETGRVAFDTQLAIAPPELVMFDATVDDEDLGARISFARADFSSESIAGLQGTNYAFRSGDFALIAMAACGGEEFDLHGDQMREFVESARARVIYE